MPFIIKKYSRTMVGFGRKPKESIIGKTFGRNDLSPRVNIRNIPWDVDLTIKERVKVGKHYAGVNLIGPCPITKHNLYWTGTYYISYYQLKRYYGQV